MEEEIRKIVIWCYEISDTTHNMNLPKEYKDFISNNIDEILWSLKNIEHKINKHEEIK